MFSIFTDVMCLIIQQEKVTSALTVPRAFDLLFAFMSLALCIRITVFSQQSELIGSYHRL